MTALDELEALSQALTIEKEEERSIYGTLQIQNSLKEQVALGITWFPCRVKHEGYGFGSYPYIIIENEHPKEDANWFQAGKNVTIFIPNKSEDLLHGTVQYAHQNTLKIVLNTNEAPEWLNIDTKIAVHVLFDEGSYVEMEVALKKVKEAHNNRLAELRETLLGYREAHYEQTSTYLPHPNLNSSQNEAVRYALSAKDVAIIHGPPGTGKTTTLVQLIRETASKQGTILVCAGSHAAVDYLTEKIAEQGLSVLRIGHWARIDETSYPYTVEGYFSKSDEQKYIEGLKRQAETYQKQAQKYKRTFTQEDRERRQFLRQEARQLFKEARHLEHQFVDTLITKVQVITCTLVGSMHPYLRHKSFETLIIDEAAQALEPACWIPITKAQRVILAGDPYQLPPTVKSYKAQQQGLSKTLIEKCIERLKIVHLLNIQYRMNAQIMGFSNQWFYSNLLEAHPSVKGHSLGNFDTPILEFIDTTGCSYDEELHPERSSYYNLGELDLLKKHLHQLYHLFIGKIDPPTIAIIAPYKEQVQQLKESLDADFYEFAHLKVNTIDAFQGQEADIVYISLVRSNSKNEIGFLGDYRRMNVALTRAKKKLVVIGDSGTLGGDAFYAQFIEYCEQHNAYSSAWSYME